MPRSPLSDRTAGPGTRYPEWGDLIDSERAKVWRQALEESAGNITHAAAVFGFSKQRGHALTMAHGLVEFAAGLRTAAGQPARGRPRT